MEWISLRPFFQSRSTFLLNRWAVGSNKLYRETLVSPWGPSCSALYVAVGGWTTGLWGDHWYTHILQKWVLKSGNVPCLCNARSTGGLTQVLLGPLTQGPLWYYRLRDMIPWGAPAWHGPGTGGEQRSLATSTTGPAGPRATLLSPKKMNMALGGARVGSHTGRPGRTHWDQNKYKENRNGSDHIHTTSGFG
jgi:hypothetical protein